MYDVAIIGAGPAGATVARLLGTRYRTLLVDRRRLDTEFGPGSAAKPCGGLLAPAAQAELARQGLGVPAKVIAGPQLFAVRTVDVTARLEQLYQRFYVNVDREAFDRWLVSLVPGSVDAGFGWSLVAAERDECGVFLRFRTPGGGSAAVRSRIVVGADGATSLLRRLAFPETPAPARYVAVQATFERGAVEPYYGAVFDESLTDFYGWTIPKRDDLLVGVAVPAGDARRAVYDRFVESLRERGFGIGREISRTSSAIARPSRLTDLCPGAGAVLLAGEAAGFISPSSAEGISYALASGAAVAGALEPGLAGAAERYRSRVFPLALKVGMKAAKSRAIYATGSRRLVMRSGLGAIPRLRPAQPVPRGEFAG